MQYCSYLGGCEAQRCIATGVWEHTVRWYFGREIGIDCNDILVVAVGDLFNAHLVAILSRKMPLHSNTIKNNVFSLHRPSWIQHPEQQSAAQPAIETYCDTFLVLYRTLVSGQRQPAGLILTRFDRVSNDSPTMSDSLREPSRFIESRTFKSTHYLFTHQIRISHT